LFRCIEALKLNDLLNCLNDVWGEVEGGGGRGERKEKVRKRKEWNG
jgi:hypothetical protein